MWDYYYNVAMALFGTLPIPRDDDEMARALGCLDSHL